jgi:dipeptidyl-peptidase-4
MQKKITYSIAILIFTAIAATAQPKKFTMEEAVLGLRGGSFVPDNLKQTQWKNKTVHYTQVIGNKENSVLIQNLPTHKKTDTLLHLSQLNAILFKKDSLKSFPSYQWNTNDQLIISYRNQRYILEPFAKQQWRLIKNYTLPTDAANATWDNANNQIAYTTGNNLLLIDAFQNTHKISNSTAANVIYGQAVHRNEFGIHNGIFFSPQNNYLAFYRMDEHMVEDYPIIDWSKTPAAVNHIKYPMAGRTSHEVSIGVYNILSQQTIYLKIAGPKDQYLTNVSWSPNEKYIFVGILNRLQNHLQWQQYDAVSGKYIKTLFEEKNDKYVEPQHPLHFISDNKFVWLSQRDGFMHLYRYNISGKLLNQITKGQWVVNQIAGIHKKENELIITATKDGAMERNIYAVDWGNGNIKKVNQNAGINNALVHTTGTYLLNTYQNPTTPRAVEILSPQKGHIKTLLIAQDKLKDYATATVENVTLYADDGTPLYGKLMKPRDFDPSQKYPVIVYLYNGPHLQLITNSYPASGNLWYDYMTQNGYIVFSMDGRGSSNRGFDFEAAIHRKVGQVEMSDQMKGVAFLKSLPYVDAHKMGVHGWSYGGFMTTSLMTQYPDIFVAGVAGGPVIDWSMYEVMYTERYMGNPQNNAQGFELTELSSKVDKIKGNLLMIHGADDDVVVWQHSLKYIEQSVKKGIQIDYYAYPGHKHNVLGKDRVHLMQKVTDYFDLHLKTK